MSWSPPQNLLLFFTLFILIPSHICFNTSLCNIFYFDSVYYTVNTDYSDESITTSSGYVYNFCHEVEYYCNASYSVMTGALIVQDSGGCSAYIQQEITHINSSNISQGIIVSYVLNQTSSTNASDTITMEYACSGTGAGCPEVQISTIFTFFQEKQLGFTIAIEIIGIIFMTLGVYIYRASIVLLGACTMFFILLAVQIPVIFYPGVPDSLINNVIIITGICSFFAGYVFGYFPKLGIFMLGSWIGLIISLTLNNVAFYFIKSTPANLTLWIVMPILAVLFGLLSLFIKRTFIIFATSLIGAYMCLRGLSWYLGAFPNQFLLARKYHLGLSGTVSWKFYVYVVALIILTASSSSLQNWMFRKRSKFNNQSGNIEEQFGNMEAEMKQKRENFAEIANFKQIFTKNKNKAPKILKRVSASQEEDEQNNSRSAELDDEVEEPSEEKPVISKRDLNKRLLAK